MEFKLLLLNNYHHIISNLNNFIKKYYTNILIKGILLFLSLGALFFILFLGVEYFLWLGEVGRFSLLFLIIIAETFLLFKFIISPLFFLFKIKKGIDDKFASLLIGNHFPEISDKLFNLLDLSDSNEKSELLIASIEQRASTLVSFNFSNAINFNESLSKTKYLILPIIVVLVIWSTGNFNSFFKSYTRVVNYNLAYEQPAPFTFELLSSDLNVYKNKSFTISLGVTGKIKPELIYIVIDGQNYLMQENNGIYEYQINAISNSIIFNFEANNYSSKSYSLNVIQTPSIIDFGLVLDYPNYTSKISDTLKSVGNATILEGTKVTWNVNSEYTDKISFKTFDTILDFNSKSNSSSFFFSKRIYNNLDYNLSTSNKDVKDFENLSYSFKVIKDEFPKISVEQLKDSLVSNEIYFSGIVSDDYGIKNVQLVYYETNNPDYIQTINLIQPNSRLDKFYYTFPSGLNLEQSKSYSFYFEVSDNDGVNGSKRTKSQTFSTSLLSDNQLKNNDLDNQQSIISNLDKSISKIKNQSESLQKITNEQKEKSSLSFNDKQKINNFLDKQELQESQMQKFSKQLKENLSKSNEDDKLNKLLQERLERQELEAKKNKKLLDELKNIADKIDKEELTQKLENLAKSQKNGQRNLEQLLELTKRYYVTEMASQLAKDLEELAKKQELLSKDNLFDNDSKTKQEQLNKSFDDLSNKLDDLNNENKALKKPLDIDVNKEESNDIKVDQKAALDQLNKSKSNADSNNDNNKQNSELQNAKMKQKSASQKMESLSKKLEQSSSGSSNSSVAEDAEVLRQILDNLIVFTFKQEALIDNLSKEEGVFENQTLSIIKQQELKNLFEHIDDSLFSLSLRVPEISENINEQITDIYYNIDKAVEDISDSRLYQGVSYQKYVLTSGNNLSDLLANILDNMQESMKSGKGSGDGENFQLPDIIKGQGQLNDKLSKSGQGKKPSSGKDGENGESGKNGSKGKDGTSEGKSNSDGGNKNDGESGNNSVNGKSNNGSNSSNGPNGNGNSNLSEEALKEIYEIYKEQELLKNNLEKQLQDMLNDSEKKLGEKLIKQMTEFQDNLLENGITQSTIEKATIINYELLKLEGASMKQGRKQERESNSNKAIFNNPILSKPLIFDNKNNEIEILNRQVLPLQQNYQNKIKEYFKSND